MKTAEDILKTMRSQANPEIIKSQEAFGIITGNSLGLTVPQMRALAKKIGKNQILALELWKTKIHEAKHMAIFIAEKEKFNEKLVEQWLKDLNSWDLVDNACSTLFKDLPFAYEKAIEWTSRNKEFEKRTGFSLMCYLTVHDKTAADAKFEQFLPYIYKESDDARNFVKKAVNWSLRQIGKRNPRLCRKAIKLGKEIRAKDDTASKWIAADALRELEKYQKEGKIKNYGKK